MPTDQDNTKIALNPIPLADQFRREMNAMMSRFFGGSSPFFPIETDAEKTGLPSLDMTGAVSPAIDINETHTAIEVTAELPGLDEDDIDLEIKDHRMILSGQKKVTHDSEGEVRVSERSYGSFLRSMALPDSADVENVTATFKKGVLRVAIPKTEPDDPGKKIKIASG